jgi:hypothetical protein
VERGDPVEVRGLLHSSLPGESVAEMARPGMAGEARTFLYQCAVQPLPPAATDDRARYRTRCLAGDGPEMTVARDSDQVWRILCVGTCRR